MSNNEMNDLMEAMGAGPVTIMPPSMADVKYTPLHFPSALVHIHQDLYVDAAKVVSVQALDQYPAECLKVVWKELANQCAAMVFVMDIEAAQQLAREIVERVNRWRGLADWPDASYRKPDEPTIINRE